MHVAVVGLGGMGSAVAAHLARRGHRVTGLDRFSPPHDRGSSHGLTRIIRQAYFEGPAYVPLLLRAYELWGELEQATGRELLRVTGGLMIGPEDSEVVTGARASAERHGLDHEVLSPAEVRDRFPAYRLGDDEVAVYEPPAGVVFPEDAVAAHLEIAARHGADLHVEAAVTGWEPTADGVTVATATGTVRADRLVLAAGAWATDLLGATLPTTVERMVPIWFHPPRDSSWEFDAQRFPVFVAHLDDEVALYGAPPRGDEGVKLAFHHGGRTGHPDELSREVADEEVEALRAVVERRFPSLHGAEARAETCFYTNTRDGDFVVGTHPEDDGVVVAAGFSGHGFKFCPVVGEVVADLVEGTAPRFDLSPFNLARLTE